MCLICSSVYIANDLIDVERDRKHPRKKLRPIASGEITPATAKANALVCLVLGLALQISLPNSAYIIGLLYLGIQGLYNRYLKQLPVVDVFVIASGFLLRVIVGALASESKISGWILLCTGCLALLLGFGKRKAELQNQGAGDQRESLRGYSIQLLNSFVTFAAAASVLSYGVYAIESPTARQYPLLIATVPIVAYAICRYLYLIFSSEEAEEPESAVLGDAHLLACFVLYISTVGIAQTGVTLNFLGQ